MRDGNVSRQSRRALSVTSCSELNGFANEKDCQRMAKDPVCGMSVDEASAFNTERDGKKFYFCTDHCLKTFVATETSAKPKRASGTCCGCCTLAGDAQRAAGDGATRP